MCKWLAAQDIFAEMMPKFWADAEAVMLVYDVTRQHTFDACGGRYQGVMDAAGKAALPGAVVANKMDQHERIAVQRAAGLHLAEQTGMQFFEASAAEGDGVAAPFEHIAAMLHKQAMEEGLEQ